MTVAPAPSAPPSGPAPLWVVQPPAPASLRSQIGVFAVGALALAILLGSVGDAQWSVPAAFALGVGAVLGIVTPAGGWFTRTAGVLVAGGVMFVALMVLLLATDGQVSESGAFGGIGLLGLFVLGLDWCYVPRLRPLVVTSGFVVLIGAADGDRWSHLGALAWLVLAFAVLTSLEADRRAAVPAAVPLAATGPAPDRGGRDVATVIAIAIAVAIVAGMVLGVPSCRRLIDPPPSAGQGDFGELGEFDGSGGSNGGSSGGSEGTGSGGTSSGGTSVGRGTAIEEGEGGAAVPHRYVPDPNGRFLVPDAATSERDPGDPPLRIPSPDAVPPLQPEERSTQVLGNGERIIYERWPDGSTLVHVEDARGRVRSFRFTPEPDGMTKIEVLDDIRRTTRTFHYDPLGVVVDGEPSQAPAASVRADQPAEDEQDDDLPNLWPVAIAVLVAALAVALGAWWWSRRPPKEVEGPAPPWALVLVARLEQAGRERQRPRHRSETILDFTNALAAEVFHDPELQEVGSILSLACFAPHLLGPDDRDRAESVVAAVLAAHPAERRSRLSRSGASG